MSRSRDSNIYIFTLWTFWGLALYCCYYFYINVISIIVFVIGDVVITTIIKDTY